MIYSDAMQQIDMIDSVDPTDNFVPTSTTPSWETERERRGSDL